MALQGATSSHSLTIVNLDDAEQTFPYSACPMPAVQTASLPEALWGTPLDPGAKPAPAANLVPGLATGIRFSPPPASAGSSVGPVDPESLITPLGGGFMALQPGSQQDPIAAPVADSGTILAIGANVASSDNVARQQRMIAALNGFGAAPPTDAPLVEVGQQAGTLYSQPPLRAAA
jgi:hypothetical protein